MTRELLLQLLSNIDWVKHGGELYVIVDPMSVNHHPKLMYLTQAQYTRMVGQVFSNDKTKLVTLATPEDTPESAAELISSPSPGSKTEEISGPAANSPQSEGSAAPKATATTPSPSAKPTSENSPPKGAIKTIDLGKEANAFVSPLLKRQGIEIRESMVTPTVGNLRSLFSIWTFVLCGILGIKYSSTLTTEVSVFSKSLGAILRANGAAFMILYLKAAYLTILAYLGEIPFVDTRGLNVCVGLTAGLPSILPNRWRILIRQRNIPYIRLVLSLLFSYRGLRGPYKDPDLTTITAPEWSGDVGPFSDFCSWYLSRFSSLFHYSRWVWGRPEDTPGKLKSSPNSSRSITGRIADWLAWSATGTGNRPHNWPLISNFVKAMFPDIGDILSQPEDPVPPPPLDDSPEEVEGSKKPVETAQKAFVALENFIFNSNIYKAVSAGVRVRIPGLLRLGRLALKMEPAGKIRIFAVVDTLTQYLLSPLHKMLERLLRKFPQDATFDQTGKVKEFANRGYSHFWSFDLKSATDLIPRVLYEVAFTPLIGADAAKAWGELLAHRDFALPGSKKYDLEGDAQEDWEYEYSRDGLTDKNDQGTKPRLGQKSQVRYSRGQPMGAKSSWPAMALVHHMIVLYCAYLVYGRKPFKAYLVLGDDVVIADKAVAQSYLEVTTQFGITIGLAKSLPGARGVFQFANQNFLGTTNISPLSLRHELSCSGPKARVTFASFIQERWGRIYSFPFIDLVCRSLPDAEKRVQFLKRVSLGYCGDFGSLIVRSLASPCGLIASRFGPAKTLITWVISLARDVPIFVWNQETKISFTKVLDLFPKPHLVSAITAILDAAAETYLAQLLRSRESFEKYFEGFPISFKHSGKTQEPVDDCELNVFWIATSRMTKEAIPEELTWGKKGTSKPKVDSKSRYNKSREKFDLEYARLGIRSLAEGIAWWTSVILPLRVSFFERVPYMEVEEFIDKAVLLINVLDRSPLVTPVSDLLVSLRNPERDNKPFVFKELDLKYGGGVFRSGPFRSRMRSEGFLLPYARKTKVSSLRANSKSLNRFKRPIAPSI